MLIEKIYSINNEYCSIDSLQNMIDLILSYDYNEKFSVVYNAIKKCALENNRSDIIHI